MHRTADNIKIVNSYSEILFNAKIVVILSSPGKAEFEQNKPAAGQTGENLRLLLEYLKCKTNNSEFHRDKISITNAWPHPLWKWKDKKTEEVNPSKLFTKENISRLEKDIGSAELVLCCGVIASKTVKNILFRLQPTIIEICHLGNQSINIRYPITRDNQSPNERRLLRVNLLGEEISAKLPANFFKK